MESLVSCRSPSWHSRLLPPAQLIQEGFFSSIAMYCNSCCRKRQKNPSRDTRTESLRSPGPAQGQAHTPQFLIQPSSAPMGVPIQPAAPETLARQEVNSMFHKMHLETGGFLPCPSTLGGDCRGWRHPTSPREPLKCTGLPPSASGKGT